MLVYCGSLRSDQARPGHEHRPAWLLLAASLCSLAAFACGLVPMPAAAQVPGLTVVVLDGSKKLRPGESTPAGVSSVRLEGARNEFEMAQLVLSWTPPPAAADSTRAAVELTAELTVLSGSGGDIALADTEIFLLHEVNVDSASDRRGKAGRWPDALVPLKRSFSIRAGDRQALVLKVHLRPGLRAGTYGGELALRSGNARQTVAVEVDVWDLDLPDRIGLPLMFGVDYESIRRFEGGLPDPAFENQVVARYYRAFRRQRVSPLFMHNGVPEIRQTAQGMQVDFASFDKRLSAMLGSRAPGPVGIPFFENWPVDPAQHALFSPRYRELAADYLRQVAAHYERRGLLARSFLYIPGTDEPVKKEQFEHARQYAQLLRAADPRLRMLQTMFMQCLDCSDGIESLEHPSLLWVPNLAFFDNRALRAELKWFGLRGIRYTEEKSNWTVDFNERVRKRQGDIWWYLNPWTSVLPPRQQPGYGNLYIDSDGIDQRVLGWMAFKHGVGALSHWNATFWQKTADPWQRVARGEEAEGSPPTVIGDGSLFYPARGSSAHTGQPDPELPITSLRLELLREGSEDHDLLALARSSGQAVLADALVAGLVRSLSDYDKDPAAYRAARRRLALALQSTTKAADKPRVRQAP